MGPSKRILSYRVAKEHNAVLESRDTTIKRLSGSKTSVFIIICLLQVKPNE